MEKYFVYLLESQKDHKFYIGQTNNLERRLAKHNNGEVNSTSGRRPFDLLGYIKLDTRKHALQFEKELKSHSDQKLKFIKNFKPDFKWKNAPD